MVDGAVPSRGHGGHRPNGVPPPAPTQWTLRAGRRPLRTVDSGHCPLCEVWAPIRRREVVKAVAQLIIKFIPGGNMGAERTRQDGVEQQFAEVTRERSVGDGGPSSTVDE